MTDDSGKHKVRPEDLEKSPNPSKKEGFSKDEIESIADLISGDPQPDPNNDLDDTGSFKR